MAAVIQMPRLSDTMTEGVIASWQKNVGETIKKGDVLAEIETDKATMELESYYDGVLLYTGTDKGGKLQVNDLLAIIGSKEEDISAIVAKHKNGAVPAAPTKKETSKKTPPTSNIRQPASIDISKMDEVVLMPRLSDTMTEGVIALWRKNVGENVKKGDVLAEIETDKATMEQESYKNGVLLYQGAQTGEKIAVNGLLAIIGEAGLNIEAIVAAAKGGVAKTSPDVAALQESKAVAIPTVAANSTQQQDAVNEGRIIASPLAKKVASEKNIDLRFVKGSGDNGRIVKNDVDNYLQSATNNPQPATRNLQPVTGNLQQVSYDEVPVSQMRKTIARRLSESLFTAPHFYLTMSINMDAAVAARGALNKDAKVKISFNDIVLKAVSVALKQHPKINSSWLGDTIRYNHHVNIGVAVAVEEGLLVPVIRFADTKSLTQIAMEVKEYAQKAKDKKLQPSDWEGSTFTISNLGMFGIDEFTAIINPPDACILAVGGISQEPVVKDGEIKIGNVMKVTLSCDHRAVDGAAGASFLQTLKALLEEPLKLLL
ncbi:MAG: pyruvate dehydrogenase complex dihydrolipoamide acetyltransferase [Chitinophagaceae bacterium]|jgi:pyruvate dehydrogenase E2 component (dihydrolipoamide acetyltransferase)|nr:pyruvate dehydrogenase complex dihydrolipoamide acetyltransferase [Chitinophagaceae bacterium]